MRILEIVLIFLPFILSIQFFLPSTIGKVEKTKLMGFLGIPVIALLLIHFLVEGAAWQMIPVYGITLVFIVMSIFQLRKFFLTKKGAVAVTATVAPRKRTGIGVILLTIVLVGTTSYLNYLWPIFVLPEPTGQYTVGTTTFDLIDSNRDEFYTTNLSDYRRILVRAWYPADQVTGLNPVPYLEHPIELGEAWKQNLGYPSFVAYHSPLITTHSYRDVPLSDAESDYPVLFFSHGGGTTEFAYTVLMQELASHGYVCFSINHPYDSLFVVFSDGSVIYRNGLHDGSLSLGIWVADTTFLLDQLNITDNSNIPDIFWGKLDFEHIGVLGHSRGGATAEELCLIDSRFDTGMSLDSPHYGHSLSWNMKKPFMLLSGPDYGSRVKDGTDRIFANSESICYGLYVEGSRHLNFADISLYTPLFKDLGMLGTIDGYRMLDILNIYVRTFFDKHIKNIDSPLLDGPSADYPEVTFLRNDQ